MAAQPLAALTLIPILDADRICLSVSRCRVRVGHVYRYARKLRTLGGMRRQCVADHRMRTGFMGVGAPEITLGVSVGRTARSTRSKSHKGQAPALLGN